MKKKEYSKLCENIFSLSFIQFVNYVLPLLTIPYLVRVLGVEYFGIVSFCLVFVNYFCIFNDYGFNLTATQQISINRDSGKVINDIYSSVMIIKSLFLLFSFFVFFLIVSLVDMFNKYEDMYLLSFLIIIGQSLFPIWVFQGLEKMKYITLVNIITKIIFTVSIFLFVNYESDYLYVPFITGVGGIISSLISIIILKYKFGVYFSFRMDGRFFSIIRKQLKDGWYVFSSSMMSTLYTTSGVFILGFYSASLVGLYSAIDKIIQAIKGFYGPLSQALYPLICKKINNRENISIIIGVYWVIILLYVLGTFICFLFSNEIIHIVLGDDYKNAVDVFKVIIFIPICTVVSNIIGVHFMLNLGMQKEFSNIIYMCSSVGLACNLLLIPIFNVMGVAYSILIAEFLISSLMVIIFFKRGKNESNSINGNV